MKHFIAAFNWTRPILDKARPRTGNTVVGIDANDEDDARAKVKARFPGTTIRNLKIKETSKLGTTDHPQQTR